MAVAQSSSGRVAICYTVSGFIGDVIFAHNGQKWVTQNGAYWKWRTGEQRETGAESAIYDWLVVVVNASASLTVRSITIGDTTSITQLSLIDPRDYRAVDRAWRSDSFLRFLALWNLCVCICASRVINCSGRASELGGIIDLVDRRRSSLSRSERPPLTT